MTHYTYDSAVALLLKQTPFEGSTYERHAIDVYEHGLHCVGIQQFMTLTEALDHWLEAYERDVHEMAQLMDGCELDNPATDVLFKWEAQEQAQSAQ